MPSHHDMLIESLTELKGNRKGTTKQAIVKYLQEKYSVEKNHYIKAALKKAVENEEILQLSGTGFAGRFKLAKVEKKASESKKTTTTKKAAVSKKKPSPTKKVTAKKNTLKKQKLAKEKKAKK